MMMSDQTIKLYVKEAEFRMVMRDIKDSGIKYWPVHRTLLSRFPHVFQYEIELVDSPLTSYLLLKYDCLCSGQGHTNPIP
jgi:hypothetical protein